MGVDLKEVKEIAVQTEEVRTRERMVEAEGQTFVSVQNFCDYYGLKYRSALYHLQKGRTGDETINILEHRSFNRQYRKAPGRSIEVKIGDDIFKSITEAAEAYGVRPDQIKQAIQAGDAAISELTGEEQSANKKVPTHVKKCVIAGVTYPSMAAAARAYGIPMATVTARMDREKISFEEALRRGHHERRRIIAEKTKWIGFSLEVFEGDIEEHKLVNSIVSLLKENSYEPVVFQDPSTRNFAIEIWESLEAISPQLELYILYDEKDLSRDVEFIIPTIGEQRPLSDAKQMELYRQITNANATYSGAKIFLRNGVFSASWSVSLSSRTLPITSFMRSLHRFVGSTARMWEEIKWAEKVSVPQK